MKLILDGKEYEFMGASLLLPGYPPMALIRMQSTEECPNVYIAYGNGLQVFVEVDAEFGASISSGTALSSALPSIISS